MSSIIFPADAFSNLPEYSNINHRNCHNDGDITENVCVCVCVCVFLVSFMDVCLDSLMFLGYGQLLVLDESFLSNSSLVDISEFVLYVLY